MSLPFISLDVPLYIALCIGSSVVSGITLCASVAKVWFLGTIPDPSVTGAWSFYGVLITAIIVLFSCGILSIRWFFSYWIKKQEELQGLTIEAINKNTTSNNAVADALRQNTDVTKKQNDWFENITQDGFRQHLGFPPKFP